MFPNGFVEAIVPAGAAVPVPPMLPQLPEPSFFTILKAAALLTQSLTS
jgi:hypothetical protein